MGGDEPKRWLLLAPPPLFVALLPLDPRNAGDARPRNVAPWLCCETSVGPTEPRPRPRTRGPGEPRLVEFVPRNRDCDLPVGCISMAAGPLPIDEPTDDVRIVHKRNYIATTLANIG